MILPAYVKADMSDMMLTFSNPFGEVKALLSIQAEVKNLLSAAQQCLVKGFTQLHIEIDSLVLISILLGKTNSPSGICREVEELLKLKHHFVVVSHIYREANQVEDFLSKLGLNYLAQDFLILC